MKAMSSVTGYYFADNVILVVALEVISWAIILGLCTLGIKGYIFAAVIFSVLIWLHLGKRWFKCSSCGHSVAKGNKT
jgi:hypothetical protein